MIVQVYKNLHNGMWSIRSKSSGRVIAHMHEVFLTNCKFIVRQGGREKVLEEKRKNVHAFVEGELKIMSNIKQISRIFTHLNYCQNVTYNPYKYNSFVIKDTGIKINKSYFCYMDSKTNEVKI